ncbi:MAG: RnfABCDGE type electron transport complex subunit D [Candidatus Pacebacteria bacterium]|nr:RnfABCDGE type electron transport complex subunit D [Candidatus Paceibacterota bacterium]
MDAIDSFLNHVTMYRLALIGLSGVAALSVILSLFGWLPYTGFELLFSLILLIIAARAANAVGALFTKASPTPESAYITALILFFILAPLQSAPDTLMLMAVAAVAMLSKYLIAINQKHLFNPAAFAVFAFSVFGSGIAVWWVANPILLPFVLVLGLLIVRKLRRFDLFWSFAIMAALVLMIRSLLSGIDIGNAASQLFVSGPLIFFGTIMVTEPQTTPPTRANRLVYGGLIGLFFSLVFQYGTLSATPELALLIGNAYSFIVGRQRRIKLRFQSSAPLTREVYELTFVSETPVKFRPGQYMEWTMPHRKSDGRGIRRHFTIASAPSDPFVRVGVRMPVESSTYKDALRELRNGAVVTATGVDGDFVLPEDPDRKIACIAGGIGITPFVSMFRELAAQHARRDIVLIYAAATPLDFVYRDEIDSYKDAIGLCIIYLPTDFAEISNWEGSSGYVTNELIKKAVPDFATRAWYLSGPDALVKDYRWLIHGMGVRNHDIFTDYFPGF